MIGTMRRPRLVVLTPVPVVAVRHAHPDLTEATARELLDDPEALWRHMTTWRAS